MRLLKRRRLPAALCRYSTPNGNIITVYQIGDRYWSEIECDGTVHSIDITEADARDHYAFAIENGVVYGGWGAS